MMRLLRLLAALAACVGPAFASTGSGTELFRQLTASVLKVEARNGDGSVSIGSGVLVAPGIVATNCHVTRNARAIELVRGALRYGVDAQHSEIEYDLCLLQSRAAVDEPVAAMQDAPPRTGQPAYAVGFILGIAPRLSAGQIRALHVYDGGKVIETDAAFTSGASGGGLFAPDGTLVGIVTFRSRSADARFFCLPVAWVRQALARFDARPVAPLSGAAFWQRPEPEQPYFLRAATLLAAQDWPHLAEVAREWSFAEAGNASSWLLLGRATASLDRTPEAIAAYRAALAIDAGLPEAWYRLGRAYQRSGDEAAARSAHRALLDLDPRLARALSRAADLCPDPEAVAC
jgi:tetratricopeptide (TPR) repeat protein